MPERRFDALNEENIEHALSYVPGYDWIPGRFGPPPGIPKSKKEQFDKLADGDYLAAFMRLGQEEKESLMISEHERRRTFAAHWPIWNIVDGYACAREGFYYTGVADRVQCAFCAGIIRNWERGDNPRQSHRNYFSYCKMAQKKPCFNIPYDDSDIPGEIRTQQLSTKKDATNMSELGISNNKPAHHDYSVSVKRMETYRRYSSSNPVAADKLCQAGFFYEGPGDKVKCFWCDGALELWERGDDPWLEHAKWYPGCAFVRQSKGADYIKAARAMMSPEDILTSNTLEYNQADLTFLDVSEDGRPVDYHKTDNYKVCKDLGFKESVLNQVYELNDKKDFTDVQDVISVAYLVTDDELDKARNKLDEIKQALTTSGRIVAESSSDKPIKIKSILMEDFIRSQADPGEEESRDIVQAMTCKECDSGTVGAVVLPCGHFCLCQDCSRTNLPSNCPECHSVVKGACRAFLC